MSVSRRSFLKGMAGAGLVGATAGLIGCSPQKETQGAATPETGAASEPITVPKGYICSEDWLGEAPAVGESDIAETRSFDVVVVGGGHAGTQAALAAAQLGASVAVIEKHKDGEIVYRGDDICSYNSKLLEGWGFGPYNLEDITNEYIRRAAGRCNSEAIRTFVYNSGEMMDNLVSLVPETSTVFDYEGKQCTVQIAFEKPNGSDYPILNGGLHQ